MPFMSSSIDVGQRSLNLGQSSEFSTEIAEESDVTARF
jgi:hypothetical protein